MFDAYSVAIRLQLVDQFSGVMGMVINRLAEGHAHADKLHRKLDSIGRLLTGGALTTGAGIGMLVALKAATNEAVKYEQQLNRLKALNLDAHLGAGTTRGLEQAALEISQRTKGTSLLDALKLITETQAITGDVRHTAELAPALARMKFGLETYMAAGGKGTGHGDKSEKQFQDVVKVMEMRGLMRNFSEDKMNRLIDLFEKSYVASGGQVKPSDFLAMMKTGGLAGKIVGEDYLFALGHIMQEKGGSRAGTALMSGYQNMIAGRTTQQVAEQLQKYGLIKPGSIEYGTTGHIKKMRPEALIASQLYQSNPLEFLMQELLPKLQAKKIDINDAQKVLPVINQMFSNRTAADQMASLYIERQQIQNYVRQAKGAFGANQLYEQGGRSVVGQELDLRKKINDLEREFGTAALPLLKAALEEAIPLVKSMGEWMKSNQGGLTKLVYGIAGLGVAMAVSGPLIVLAGAIGGLRLVTGMGSASAGIFSHKLSEIPWNKTMGQIEGVGGKLRVLGDAGAAFGIGWTVGTLLHETVLEGTKFDHVLGRLVARFLAIIGIGSKEELERNDDNENAVNGMLKQRARPQTVVPSSFSADHERRTAQAHAAVSAPQMVQVTTHINLDGRKMGQAVSTYQARELGRPQTGPRGFDNTISLRPGDVPPPGAF